VVCAGGGVGGEGGEVEDGSGGGDDDRVGADQDVAPGRHAEVPAEGVDGDARADGDRGAPGGGRNRQAGGDAVPVQGRGVHPQQR
jgi:hypothetical protein